MATLAMVVTIRVYMDDDDAEDETVLDDIASQIELGCEAIESRLKERYPTAFDRFEVDA